MYLHIYMETGPSYYSCLSHRHCYYLERRLLPVLLHKTLMTIHLTVAVPLPLLSRNR